MGSNDEITRKEFLTLTFTLIGAAAVGCDDNNNNASTGTGGRGGTTGTAGHGGAGGTTGGTGGAGGTATAPTASCSDPLPEMQAPSDHTHSVDIPASTLNATSAQTFDTSVAVGHMHMVTLQPSDLTTLKGGSSVMVTSTVAVGHSHVFTVSCH